MTTQLATQHSVAQDFSSLNFILYKPANLFYNRLTIIMKEGVYA